MTTNSVQTSRATSWDVARLAGVSRSTVSQILNGNDERFPQETRDRVTAAATTLAYRPSRAGRSLVTGLSDIIMVVVPNVTFGRHLQDAVDRIAAASASRGLSVVVRYAGVDPAATLTAVLDLRPTMVLDMGVFDKTARTAITAAGILILPGDDAFDRIDENPNHFVGRLQARHLLEHPERMLVCALIIDDRVDLFGPERLQGVIDEAAVLGAPEPLLMRVPLALAGAVEALSAVVEASAGKSLGVCCYNDDVAIAVLAAARELGLAVPERVAIVGVDNTAIGQLVEPRLTTIAVDVVGILGDLDQWLPQGEAQAEPFKDPSRYTKLVPGDST